MAKPQLVMSFADMEALQTEFQANLRNGGTLVRGAEGVDVGVACEVTFVHPNDDSKLTLDAEVVMVNDAGPMKGVAVQFAGFDESLVVRLKAFVKRGETARPEEQEPKHVQERIRKLSATEQQRVAREGDLSERAALERVYGKQVWAALLRNPKLTAPEVTRIARMPQLPQPLLDLIVDNNSFLSSPQVRRALLTHGRLPAKAIRKILGLTPKNEIKAMPKQSAYPNAVREAARKLLQSGSG